MPVELVFLTSFVSAVIKVLAKKLADAALSEINNYLNVEQNLAELSDGIYTVQIALERVDEHNSAHATFRSWVLDLTMICYDVDDIIDDINLEIMRLEHQHRVAEPGCWSRLASCVNYRDPVHQVISSSVEKWNVPRRIVDMLRRLDNIKRNVNDVARHNNPAGGQTGRDQVRRPGGFGLAYNTSLPEGRLIEKLEIIEKLLPMHDCGVCIVGMAGLGKSVLADFILNDKMIKSKFNVIQRASMSHWNFDDGINLETIYSSSSGSNCNTTGISLVLLDDLRITCIRDWRSIKAALVEKLKHDHLMVVLITSRDPAVAKFTQTDLHHLRPLSIQDCEEIINSKVYPILTFNDVNNRRVLESKVNSVARKCGGLPLVADLIGDYLRSEYRSNRNNFSNAISSFVDGDLWELDVFLREILPELGFDKTSLPHNLYKFLAYFALFPSEYYFTKNDLSLMWMAEGLGTITQELMLRPAIDDFESLTATSMLRVVTTSSLKDIETPSTYKLHNFAHKFAKIIACNTHFWLDEARLSSINNGYDLPGSNIRHFSSCCQILQGIILNYIGKNQSRLRTFLLLPEYDIKIQNVPQSFFMKLEYLRVLSLRGSNVTTIPIKNMKHLSYFDASYTCITRLPSDLCGLLCLQVLKLKPCQYLCCLPENFGGLTNLIHLELDMKRLFSTPTNLGRLTKLQTLPVFIVKELVGHRISELKNLNSLRDSLKISKLENISHIGEAREAMLSSKPKITKLELEWIDMSKQSSSIAEDVFTCLEPSKNLKELKISNYIGNTIPIWVCTLKDLESIDLYNFPICTNLPPLGLLPLLKKLKIEKMCELKSVQRSHLRRSKQHGEYLALEHLEIRDMDKLFKWDLLVPDDMPHLRKLVVTKCPKLVHMPMIRSHRCFNQLEISDCRRLNAFQV